MKKVTAIVGAARKKHTYEAVREFLGKLEALGEVETEIVRLSDYRVEMCRGCKVCFERGEEFCPFADDDRDALLAKMEASDGVIFASPNYSFQVSGLMKVFLDRLGFAFHRPRFHGKAYTSIVAQGVFGGDKIVKYLEFVGRGLGFGVVKGSVFTAFEPMTEKEATKRDAALAKQALRFHRQLSKPAGRAPGLMELLVFRWARTSIGLELDDTSRDFTYYRDHGWFESDYYYPTRLGPLKTLVGRVVDWSFGVALKGNADSRRAQSSAAS